MSSLEMIEKKPSKVKQIVMCVGERAGTERWLHERWATGGGVVA